MVAYHYERGKHPQTGWDVISLYCTNDTPAERCVASISPEKGANLLSFQVGGTEYLYGIAQPGDTLMLLGTPVLYPTPNRVRNAHFVFDGRTFRFPANNGPHFLHGLVRDVPWACDTPTVGPNGISVTARMAMAPGSGPYELFPIRNTLSLTLTLRPSTVRFDFTVQNDDLERRLPFGLAIHPYFRILGPRESVRLQVPAQKWMEAVDLIPTGRLLDIEEGPADLRQPMSLAQLDLDDVFWGLDEAHPQVIYYDDLGKKVTLRASDFFTHSVIYTPVGRPFFCVENQSCSTDAHNLYAKGFTEAAHLTVLDPGESQTAWIEFQISEQ